MNEINQIEDHLVSVYKEIGNLKNANELKDQEKRDLFKKLILGIIDVIDTFERVVSNLKEKSLDETEIAMKSSM